MSPAWKGHASRPAKPNCHPPTMLDLQGKRGGMGLDLLLRPWSDCREQGLCVSELLLRIPLFFSIAFCNGIENGKRPAGVISFSLNHFNFNYLPTLRVFRYTTKDRVTKII